MAPDDPIVLLLEGDGAGPDRWWARARIFGAAVSKICSGQARIVWSQVLAGEEARDAVGEWLPADALEAVRV